MKREFRSSSPEETLRIAEELGRTLRGGEIILFRGSLGAGKTLFTKGILNAAGFDADDVTSPSFALVNLYKAKFEVFHIDLWRLKEDSDPGFAVGLDEIMENENAVVIVEWAERLSGFDFGRPVINVEISGSGDSDRSITINYELGTEAAPAG